MSAAFRLAPTGPPARCGYPGCILHDFHEGGHEFRNEKGYKFHCVVCGRHMVRYADPAVHAISPDLCDSDLCLDHWCRSQPIPPQFPICNCAQRPYPHELSVHLELRSESYNPKLKFVWPWSLMRSDRAELSTERKAAA